LPGPRHEAEVIKQAIATFVQNQNSRLELSADKTLITHASTGKSPLFPSGYELVNPAQRQPP